MSLPKESRASLALLSAIVLAHEILLTRVLSFTLHTMLVFVVLGLAMLGFGAAGALVALSREWSEGHGAARASARWAVAFAITLVISMAIFVRIAPRMTLGFGWALVGAVVLSAPYVCAGAVVAIELSRNASAPGRTYAANLAGSAAGCVAPFVAIGPLGVEALVGWLALGAAVAAAGFAAAATDRAAMVGAASAGALALGSALGSGHAFPMKPDPESHVSIVSAAMEKSGARVERVFDRWNAVGRIEVFEFHDVPGSPEPYPYRFYAQDNTAGALVARWDGRPRASRGADEPVSGVAALCTDTIYGQGYYRKRARVLVIGVGGGLDVQCALYHGAEHVDAVEINPDAIRALRGPMNEFVGGVGTSDRVRWHVADGRSFAHGAGGSDYDLITLSGADTKQFAAAAALALDENTLYTREAFGDYLRATGESGAVAILRFFEVDAHRLAVAATAALRDLGMPAPQNHFIIIQNNLEYGVLIRRTPFPPSERSSHFAHILDPQKPFVGADIAFFKPIKFLVPARPSLLYPGEPRAASFVELFEQAARGDTSAFVRSQPLDVSAPTDDRPFFFDHARYEEPSALVHPHVQWMFNLVFAVLLLATALILVPLWPLSRADPSARKLAPFLFFSGIGLGFLLLEIWLIHRFATFLGHHTYAMSVVIGGLLAGTGLGALVGERVASEPGRRAPMGIVFAMIIVAVGLIAIGPLLEASWQWHRVARALVVLGFVAPLGVALGLPFPAGLAWVAGRHVRLVPWCVGVNAFASVLGSTVSVPVAHIAGYNAVLQGAMLSYALALVVSARIPRAAEP